MWRTLRVPDQRLGGQGHLWCHIWSYLTQRKIPWKFCVYISNASASGRGGQEGVTWRTLRVPDGRHGGHGCSWCHEWGFLPLGRYPENFVLIYQLEVRQEGGVKKGVLGGLWGLPDGRHGWHGRSWHHEWCFFTPKKIAWKFRVDICIGSVSGRGGQEGGTWRTFGGFLTEDFKDGVILEVMDDLGRV